MVVRAMAARKQATAVGGGAWAKLWRLTRDGHVRANGPPSWLAHDSVVQTRLLHCKAHRVASCLQLGKQTPTSNGHLGEGWYPTHYARGCCVLFAAKNLSKDILHSMQERRAWLPSFLPPELPSITKTPTALLRFRQSLAACIALCLLPLALSHPITLFVAIDGLDAIGCGSTALTACASLKFAVDESVPRHGAGDMVVSVGPGHYNSSSCNVTIVQSVTIIGSGSGTTVIDCEHTAWGIRSTVAASDVTVANLTITNGFASDDAYGGPNGAAIFVMWESTAQLPAHRQPSVTFEGLVVSNSTCTGTGDSQALGGAIAVAMHGAHWASGASITVRACSLMGNNVVTNKSNLALGGHGDSDSSALGTSGFSFLSDGSGLTTGLHVLVEDSTITSGSDALATTEPDAAGMVPQVVLYAAWWCLVERCSLTAPLGSPQREQWDWVCFCSAQCGDSEASRLVAASQRFSVVVAPSSTRRSQYETV